MCIALNASKRRTCAARGNRSSNTVPLPVPEVPWVTQITSEPPDVTLTHETSGRAAIPSASASAEPGRHRMRANQA